jgi:uncharacterized protein
MAEKRIDPKILKVIRYFKKRLEETGVDVTYIVVFGSQVKGKVHPDSDIDMIVVSKDFRRKNIAIRAEIIRNAYADTIKKFMIPIDLVMETPEEFNPDFGVIVYAA